MHIIVGNAPNVRKDPDKKPPTYGGADKGKFREKRKNKQDRRKSNRDGVIVTISVPDDRRVVPERRRG